MKIAVFMSVLSLCLSGCYYLQSTKNPIGYIKYPHSDVNASDGNAPKRLMILLPGMGDRAKVFEKQKIIDVLHSFVPSFDVVAVEAHFKYYQNKTVIDRVHHDIVLPAIASGYEEIYFAGNSLGGLGSLLYLKEHPDMVKAIVVLAPYLGEADEYQYLLDGSPRNEEKIKIDLWPWITSLPQNQREKIFLAYGLSDKFAESNTLFSSYLPEGHSLTIKGDHLWTTWKKLWPDIVCNMLTTKAVLRRC